MRNKSGIKLKMILVGVTIFFSFSVEGQITFSSNYYKEFSEENGEWVQKSHEIAPTSIMILKDGQNVNWKSIWNPLGKDFLVLDYEKTNMGMRFLLKRDEGKLFGMDFNIEKIGMDINIEEKYITITAEKNSLPYIQIIYISEIKVDDD